MNGRESTTSATVGESPWIRRDAALAQGDFDQALPGFLEAAAPLSATAVTREPDDARVSIAASGSRLKVQVGRYEHAIPWPKDDDEAPETARWIARRRRRPAPIDAGARPPAQGCA